MDSLKKNDDCYFYYYSSCMKAESCPFRHEPSALGIETVCNYWKQGKCSKLHCNFRHMEVRKNRNVIPCYWESQPNGCRKPHCPFQHKSSRDGLQQESDSNKDLILPVGSGLHDSHDHGSSADREGNELDKTPASFVSSPPVDPLVVNFEEESDNESVPSTTPIKRGGRSIHIKTLEEIRLERIQAESAAFYQYDDSDTEVLPSDNSPNSLPAESPKSRLSRDPPEQLELRKRITGRRSYQNGDTETTSNVKIIGNSKTPGNGTPVFKVLSLQEIRQSKRRKDNDDQSEEKIAIENNTPNKQQTENVNKLIVEEKKESIEDIECNKTSPRKRSHSPVVFGVSEKKVKQIESLPDKKVSENNLSPPKPIVVVAARKRPHSEEYVENLASKPSQTAADDDGSKRCTTSSAPVSPVPAVRPTRKIWRSSRQIKKDEQESVKKSGDSGSDTTSDTTSVFTRKLRIKKNFVKPIINPSLKHDDNQSISTSDKSSVFVPENNSLSSSCDIKEEKSPDLLKAQSKNHSSLPPMHVHPTTPKRNLPPPLHVITPSTPTPNNHGDLEEDLSLLSPTQDTDISLSISRGADDILQDIDDLLND